MTTAPGRDSAVIIGAGIAGLATANALAFRFDRVLILDRDELPELAEPRRGVPHGGHGHVLLGSGLAALERLFPGLLDELVAGGAVPFDPGVDLSLHRFGAVWSRSSSGLRLMSCSRPYLEHTLRTRVRSLSNVTLRTGAAVSDLTGTAEQITGVTLDDGTAVATDLVVDCTGRGSRSDRWLAGLGLPTPAVTEVKIGVGYATRLYRRRPGDLTDAVGAFVLPAAPHEKRAGLALPIEGNRWLVSMGGWHGDFPDSEDTFLAHSRSLPHRGLVELVDNAEPVSELAVHRFPSSRRRRFEDLTRVPGGYLALGDAICSFNPIYGQGMTCAALEANALSELLDRSGLPDARLTTDFYRATAAIIATPWQFAVGGDFAYPETPGERPRGMKLLNRYSRRIQLAAQVDPEVRRVFTSVQHLLLPPAELRRPSMVLRVLRAARRSPGARLGY